MFVEVFKAGNYLDQELSVLFVALPLGTSFALRIWWRLLHCGVTGVCNSSGFRIKSLKKYHWTGIWLLVLETLQV